MIKISHECPLQVLRESYLFNDYDYCLVHLTNSNWKYKNYYVRSVKKGRDVLLDNSIFELGKSFDPKRFVKKILQLQPTQYIVPDVLDDGNGTIVKFQEFNNITSNIKLGGVKIGVVQGKTYEEIKKCYDFMSKNADKIAISFNMEYFLENEKGDCDLDKFATGRPNLIKKLQDEGIWNKQKPHHLLGCALYEEFSKNRELYNTSFIESIDTSNPVVAGIFGLKYDGVRGLKEKPSIKLCDLINEKLSKKQIDTIMYNICMFREGLNG